MLPPRVLSKCNYPPLYFFLLFSCFIKHALEPFIVVRTSLPGCSYLVIVLVMFTPLFSLFALVLASSLALISVAVIDVRVIHRCEFEYINRS